MRVQITLIKNWPEMEVKLLCGFLSKGWKTCGDDSSSECNNHVSIPFDKISRCYYS